ncbi:MAG: bifunctional phosphopantothenoylcysteine decarboxylase/phosphopantothenate--cysteine ligase CoaBC [Methanomassiliicoccales archaeon]|nr:MAG: bifunctional phosphopantothenoylcysteine decarboxylase/phosphopantothenate--cysteine ligase CoaBC [Methanomassiliicoccales archaeon]
MHPSQAIYCQKSEKLKDKTIVLGVTGSVAAVECVKLIRELIRHGAKVIPVMSEWGQKIVHPYSLEFASGQKPIIQIDGSVQYVDLCGEGGSADLFMVAPCTANTISKIAHGITDTQVTIFAIASMGSKIPIILVPAMHISLYDQPIIGDNIRRLKELGVEFVRPRIQEHKAKIAKIDQIVSSVIRALGPGDLKKKVTVIAGSTEEPVDDVRILTNRSTGRTGIELALDAYERGAQVELWMGRTTEEIPSFITTKRFSTSLELVDMVRKIRSDICIVPAAISDYIPKRAKGKISSTKRQVTVELRRAPKIIEEIRRSRKKITIIGFKLESDISKKALVSKAKERLRTAKLDFIVANDIKSVTPDSNKVIIIDKKGRTKDVDGSKPKIAHEIWSAVLNGIKG